jgi:hypothetical protein
MFKLRWNSAQCTSRINTWYTTVFIYSNHLPQITNDNSRIALFADGTSMIITNTNPSISEISVNNIIQDKNERFHTNLLSLNMDKQGSYNLWLKTSLQLILILCHGNRKIANVYITNFLALQLDNTLSWRTHTDAIIPTLSPASFAITVVKPFLSQGSLKMVHYSYFHSVDDTD